MAQYGSSTPAVADARSRAVRTLVQGLALDVATAVVLVLVTYTAGGIEWTGAYWLALGSLAAKSAIMSVVSYAHRRLGGTPQ